MSRVFIAWGSYDKSKPRVRLLLEELRARDLLHTEINIPAWATIRDKAVAELGTLIKAALRLLLLYPSALLKLVRLPPRSILLLPYPAIPDIFMAWPIARLRHHTIVFDAFISIYDTVVSDRAMVQEQGIAARLIWMIERTALKLTDIILVDTDQNGDYLAREFGIPRDRFQTVLVGAEHAFWVRNIDPAVLPADIPPDRAIVLFFGQLIPLHGIDTILEAARLTVGDAIHWLIIGGGQESFKVRKYQAEYGSRNSSWIPWVNYEQLPAYISAASLALGIFGSSDKSARVIPNKAYQIIAAGKPLITRASPAMDVIVKRYSQAVVTVPASDAAALAKAVREASKVSVEWRPVPLAAEAELGPANGVEALLERVQ